MLAVLTGGTGFIGSHMVLALRAAGACVRVLRRAGAADTVPVALPDGVEVHVVDFADERAVAASPALDGATHCFHLAAATRAWNASEFDRSNVLPARTFARACAARGTDSPRFVFLSSLAAAGPSWSAARPRCEADAPAPIEPYGASKLAAEREVTAVGDRVPVTILRPASVYGPRDRDFLRAFYQAQGRVAVYAARADQALSIVHVHDLVRAMMLAATHTAAAGRTYYIAAPEPVTWRDLYGAVANAAGTVLRAVQLPEWTLTAAAALSPLFSRRDRPPFVTWQKVALARPRWWTCDASLARGELGWREEIPFAEGVRATYEWYCEAGWLDRRTRRTHRTRRGAVAA